MSSLANYANHTLTQNHIDKSINRLRQEHEDAWKRLQLEKELDKRSENQKKWLNETFGQGSGGAGWTFTLKKGKKRSHAVWVPPGGGAGINTFPNICAWMAKKVS